MDEVRACARVLAPTLLLVLAGTAQATTAPLVISPDPLIEYRAFRVRLDGPFGQPAPVVQVRIEAGQIIVQTSSVDYVDPSLPPVAAVEAVAFAPAAGTYELIDVRCAGNPPPPLPGCTIASRRHIEVGPVPPIPSTGFASLAALALGCAGIARRALRRARA
jgi:hypothetical protein